MGVSCLRELRADPALAWMALERQGGAAPVQAPLWARLLGGGGGSGSSAELCLLDVACPAAREALLRGGLLCGRYLLRRGAALAGEVLVPALDLAVQPGSRGRLVHLVFLRSRDAFERERAARRAVRRAVGASAADELLLRLLRAHEPDVPPAAGWGSRGGAADGFDAGPAPSGWAAQLAVHGLPPYLLVFERSRCSLDDLLEEQSREAAAFAEYTAASLRARLPGAPRTRLPSIQPDWEAVRVLGVGIAAVLAALHEGGLAHCALTPAAVRIAGPPEQPRLLLCRLHATCSLHQNRLELLTTDSASAAFAGRLPPEVCLRGEDGDVALCLVPRGAVGAWPPGARPASRAADMWAYGSLLYEALAGEPLLPPPPDTLVALAAWNDDSLDDALRRLCARCGVRDAGARPARDALRLLRRCLAADSAKRPTEARDLLASRFLNPHGRRVPPRAAQLLEWARSGEGAREAEAGDDGGGAAVLEGVPAY